MGLLFGHCMCMTNGQGSIDFHQTSLWLQYITLFIRLKKCWWSCKLAVETLQDHSNLSSKRVSNLFITGSHCFHFPNSNISVIPYTHVQRGQTFSITASIVLFPDLLKTTVSKPHRKKPLSVWITGSFLFLIRQYVTQDSSNCCPSVSGTTFPESFQVVGMS